MKTECLEGYRRYVATLTAQRRSGASLDRRSGPVYLPVTPRNREYLRALREAEMLAWERATPEPDGGPHAHRSAGVTPSDRE